MTEMSKGTFVLIKWTWISLSEEEILKNESHQALKDKTKDDSSTKLIQNPCSNTRFIAYYILFHRQMFNFICIDAQVSINTNGFIASVPFRTIVFAMVVNMQIR